MESYIQVIKTMEKKEDAEKIAKTIKRSTFTRHRRLSPYPLLTAAANIWDDYVTN